MSWRYMAARRTADGEEIWDIREYYDAIPNGAGKTAEDGEAWTVDPICPSGESLDELRQDLTNMLNDIVDPKHFLDLDKVPPGLEELP